jgi:hypothetical protein
VKSNLFTFERHGRKHGPFSELEIVRLVQDGFIAPDTLVISPLGNQLRADTVSLQPSISDEAPPLPYSSRKLTWDPCIIAWLGLVFSPFWSGAMAALNARRLGIDLPIWRPMIVALVGFTLDILLALLGMSSYLVSVALFVGAAWLIWHFDLKLQVEAHRQRASASQDHWHWFFPLLAGGPLGTLVFLAFIVAPMLPPTPEYVQANNLGVEQLQRGEYEQAIKSFDRVIQLNPDLAAR